MSLPNSRSYHVTIRVSGKLFQGHLSYLDQLVNSATECRLWPLLSLSQLEELDRELERYHKMLDACGVPPAAQANIFAGTLWRILQRDH